MFELLVAHFGTSALVPGDLYSFLLFSVTPMAASSSNKMETPDPDWDFLQPNLPINQVDWDLVKTYLFDRFTTPPTEFIHRQGQTIIPDVHPNRICEHIMHFRPCPSFTDPAYRCPGYHPEFLLQGPDVIWTPRTWSCRAFQRRTDLAHQDHCHRPECQQLHRPGWAHSELVAFRSWALSVHRAYWFTIYCCQPNINGKTPLYVTHYQDIQHCLTNQAYLPYADFIKHSWKETVEPPLTYLLDTPSHVPPFAANYYDDERVQQRRVQRQRSQTPRRPRPAQAAPEPTEAQTSTNFLPNNTQRPSTTVHASPRFGQGTPPRSRQPTGSDHTRPTSSFPTPTATPTSFTPPMPAPSTPSPSPISAPCSIPVVPPSPSYTTQWPPTYTTASHPWAEPDSDGLPTPAANLRVTAPPNLEPSHALQISLQESRYNFFTQPIPRALLPRLHQLPVLRRWTIRPIRQLADPYPTSEWHLCPAPSELQRRRIFQHNDVVGTFISTILTPPGPTGVHRTDAHDPTPHQHRRSRDCHFDQLLLHQDEPGTSLGLPDQPRQSRWDHSDLPERMAEFRRRPIPAFPQPKRHICQIQLQRGLRDLRSPHCKHSGTPKGVGRQRPQHPSWPDFWTPSIPSLRRDGRKSPIRSRWIQAMSDNWLLYSWPVTNFFWHPRAKMAPRPWLQVRYDAWTGNRIPFVHSHTPVLRFHVLKHFSFTTLILWMFQDRHLCNKFAMTARSHNTAQTLRH